MHVQVVAPVRETAAQALGMAARALPLPQLQATVAVLCQLVGNIQWDVRQGGLLGLKFLLAAVSGADAASLMDSALPATLQALQVRTFLCASALLGLEHSWTWNNHA